MSDANITDNLSRVQHVETTLVWGVRRHCDLRDGYLASGFIKQITFCKVLIGVSMKMN